MVDDRRAALVVDLDPAGPRTTLVDTLRRELGDPALDIVYWRPTTGSWIDELGRPTTTPAAVARRALTAIERRGERVAALIHDPVLLADPELLRTASAASAEAIDGERLERSWARPRPPRPVDHSIAAPATDTSP